MGILGLSVWKILTFNYRYSCQHSRFRYLQQPSRVAFHGLRNALLPHCSVGNVLDFGTELSPVTFWTQPPVNQWAVTLSLDDGCFWAYILIDIGWLLSSSLRSDLRTLIEGLGCFPLHHGRCSSWCVCWLITQKDIRSLVGFNITFVMPTHPELYPPLRWNQQPTYIGFAENQLSPSLIGLSPLTTDHPSVLQHARVRSFNRD